MGYKQNGLVSSILVSPETGSRNANRETISFALQTKNNSSHTDNVCFRKARSKHVHSWHAISWNHSWTLNSILLQAKYCGHSICKCQVWVIYLHRWNTKGHWIYMTIMAAYSNYSLLKHDTHEDFRKFDILGTTVQDFYKNISKLFLPRFSCVTTEGNRNIPWWKSLEYNHF